MNGYFIKIFRTGRVSNAIRNGPGAINRLIGSKKAIKENKNAGIVFMC